MWNKLNALGELKTGNNNEEKIEYKYCMFVINFSFKTL